MHGPINVKSPNNTSKWQMGFNSAFKGLIMKNAKKRDQTMEVWLH
jgi:Leu/Phe-tRNA-protein transferase